MRLLIRGSKVQVLEGAQNESTDSKESVFFLFTAIYKKQIYGKTISILIMMFFVFLTLNILLLSWTIKHPSF